MRTKWVLRGFGIAYLLVALSLVPVGKVLPAPLEDAWEIFAGVIFGLITVISVGLLQGSSLLGGPLALTTGIRPAYANEGLLALICVVVAVYSAVHLLRKDTTPGRRGVCMFFLLLSLSIIVMVRFTMLAWAHFA
jgi:hypothetical protein